MFLGDVAAPPGHDPGVLHHDCVHVFHLREVKEIVKPLYFQHFATLPGALQILAHRTHHQWQNLPKPCHLSAVEHIHHLPFTPASWTLKWRVIIREQPVVLRDYQGLFVVPALEDNWWNFLQNLRRPLGKTLPGKGAVQTEFGFRGQGVKIRSKLNVAVPLWIFTITEILNFRKISLLPTKISILIPSQNNVWPLSLSDGGSQVGNPNWPSWQCANFGYIFITNGGSQLSFYRVVF